MFEMKRCVVLATIVLVIFAIIITLVNFDIQEMPATTSGGMRREAPVFY